MELTTDNLFALDLLKNSDLYDPLPVDRIARDIGNHPELFEQVELNATETKNCFSIGDDGPSAPKCVQAITLTITLSGADDLAAIELMKPWEPPWIDDNILFGKQMLTLTWPTGHEWEKFKADCATLLAADE